MFFQMTIGTPPVKKPPLRPRRGVGMFRKAKHEVQREAHRYMTAGGRVMASPDQPRRMNEDEIKAKREEMKNVF